MISGIKPNEDHIKEFNSLKLSKSSKVLIFKISGTKTEGNLELEFKGDKDFDYKTLYEILPSDEPRYVVYDFEYYTDEKPPRKTNKLILFFWCPTACSITNKFLYASTKDSVRGSFNGIQKDIQASDLSEIDFDSVRKDLL